MALSQLCTTKSHAHQECMEILTLFKQLLQGLATSAQLVVTAPVVASNQLHAQLAIFALLKLGSELSSHVLSVVIIQTLASL